MKITKIVPESSQDQIIRQITFDVETRKCWAQVDYYGESPRSENVEVDFTDQWTAATLENRTVIKKFFKSIMAIAWGVLETEIPDTVFEPND